MKPPRWIDHSQIFHQYMAIIFQQQMRWYWADLSAITNQTKRRNPKMDVAISHWQLVKSSTEPNRQPANISGKFIDGMETGLDEKQNTKHELCWTCSVPCFHVIITGFSGTSDAFSGWIIWLSIRRRNKKMFLWSCQKRRSKSRRRKKHFGGV